MKYRIENMACGGCAHSVTDIIQSVDPEGGIIKDLVLKSVEIVSKKTSALFIGALAEAGFPAS